MSKLYQQGDVLVFKEDKIPESATPLKSDGRGIVLAEGEVTGHYHAITELDRCESFKDSVGNTWLDVKSPVKIKHQEHKQVTLPKGKYRIGIVREVDPFAEEIHKVKD
jgi:hypothetical protein